jgi:hypothetical protein
MISALYIPDKTIELSLFPPSKYAMIMFYRTPIDSSLSEKALRAATRTDFSFPAQLNYSINPPEKKVP